jgi:sec-independent protein translocase protein TatC
MVKVNKSTITGTYPIEGNRMTEENPKEMSIWDHLTELRNRLLIAAISMVVATAISLSVTQKFIELLAEPIGGLSKLISIEVTENVSVFMRVSLLGGAILAMPVIVYELLSYVLPGLTTSEKKWVFIAVPSASLLFLSGVVFSYLVMLPAAIPFLVGFLTGITATPRLSSYIGFVTNLMFWIGISFELPLFAFVLAKLKIVTARQLLRQWRIAIVVIAVIAAAVTPTVDPINMSILMIPLFVLYMLSVLLAAIARR